MYNGMQFNGSGKCLRQSRLLAFISPARIKRSIYKGERFSTVFPRANSSLSQPKKFHFVSCYYRRPLLRHFSQLLRTRDAFKKRLENYRVIGVAFQERENFGFRARLLCIFFSTLRERERETYPLRLEAGLPFAVAHCANRSGE